MWPIVVRSANPFHNSADFNFKLPSNANPDTFFAELRAAGLTEGKFCVSRMKKETDEWWYRYLFYPVERQCKGHWKRRDDHIKRTFNHYLRDLKERIGHKFEALPEPGTRGGKS